MNETFFGGIEGGGTKFVCAIGNTQGKILNQTRFPTTSPEATLQQAVDFFQQQTPVYGKLKALGIACFGPLDPNPNSASYGYILPTPKPGWSNTNVVGKFEAALDLPIAFDTDVNGAALGEWHWGAAQGLDNFIYFTIGTGIGGGTMVEGHLLHGLLHPEMGHIPLPHNRIADPFPGICPFHGDCFEGLASGTAMNQRWGQPAETLPPDHPAWELEAEYIALALQGFICTLSPQRIIIGGGVTQQPHLMAMIRNNTLARLNGYVQSEVVTGQINTYIVTPELASNAGICGAIALAKRKYELN